MLAEEGDTDSEDEMRIRQEAFQRLIGFIVKGTKLNPSNVASRVMILGAAFAPGALAAENGSGSMDTTLTELGKRLGRTRAAVSARAIGLANEVSQMGGHRIRFNFQRSDGTRDANRCAAMGNSSRLGK